MNERNCFPGIKINGDMLKFISMILSIAAAYFLTIQSIKIDLAAKAESAVVEKLDKKLTNIEVIISERAVNKEQFYQFSKDVEARLARIETLLKENAGEKNGKH